MPYQVQGLDLPSIFLAAQQARANEQAFQLNQMRMAEAQRQQDMQRWLPQARMDYFQGQPTDLQRLAPEEFVKLQGAEAERAKIAAQTRAAGLETEAKQKEAAQARRTATNQALLGAIDAYEKNPAAYGQIYEQMRDMWSNGIIDRVGLPPPPTPGQPQASILPAPGSPQLQQMRAAIKSQMPVEKQTNDIENALFAAGGNKERAARILEKKMQSSGVNVNVGEKTLPTTVVQEMSDADTALTILGDTGKAFAANVPRSSFFNQLKARGERYVPNSDVANYMNDVSSAAQVVGTFLESGKLAEADLPRYVNMFPLPGDNEETARKKIDNLARKIRLRAAGRNTALQQAGYKTPELSAQMRGETASSPMGDGNPVGDVSFTGQELPPPPVDAQRREPAAQPATIDMSQPAAQAPGRVAPFELPQSVQGPLDLSGASGPQDMPPQGQAMRRDPGNQSAQAQVGAAERGEQITRSLFDAGKTPAEVLAELERARLVGPKNRAKAFENLTKRYEKRQKKGGRPNG